MQRVRFLFAIPEGSSHNCNAYSVVKNSDNALVEEATFFFFCGVGGFACYS